MKKTLLDLNSRSWRKRAQAADDLCAKPDPLAREMLVQLLDDPVAEVRANAASALGALGPPVEALPGLIKLLKDEDEQCNNSAVHAIAKMGDQAADAIPYLFDMLPKEDFGMQTLILTAIASIGIIDDEYLPVITEHLKGGNDSVSIASCEVLAKMGPNAVEAAPAVVSVLKKSDGFLAANAAIALWKIDKNGIAVDALLELLSDSADDEVRRVAAEFSGGIDDPKILKGLMKALGDPEEVVQIYAAESIWKLTNDPKPIVACLKRLHTSDDDVVRRLTVLQLGRMIGKYRGAKGLIQASMNDDSEIVREAAEEVLGS